MHFKQSVVTPLLKKLSLDKDTLNNYRPISNLSLISKITERIVKFRLNEYLSNSLYNPNQSAYTKYHSTETTLLSLQYHLITAISHQQVSCLCLLDFSAAFDTIDHSILLHRLSSWFGIADSAPTWFKTYITSRSFSVIVSYFASPPYPLSCAYPKALPLALSFSTCTPHLSALSSHPGH